MKTYRYKVVRLHGTKPDTLTSELDVLGRDGWRLVSVYSGKMFFVRSERSHRSGDPNSCPIEK